jgi:hypothetical protein
VQVIARLVTNTTANFSQLAVCSPAVSWRQLLTAEIVQLHSLRPSLYSLPRRIDSQLCPLLITSQHGPRRNTAICCSNSVVFVGACLQGRYSATALVYFLISRPLPGSESTCYSIFSSPDKPYVFVNASIMNHVHVRIPVLMLRRSEQCLQFDCILVMKHRLCFMYFVAEFEKKKYVSEAIAEAVSRWLPTAAARVHVRVWSSRIRGGRSGAGAGFLLVLWFPLPIFIPPNSPSSESPRARTIGQKWPTCRVDPVWTTSPH